MGDLGKKAKGKAAEEEKAGEKKSRHVIAKQKNRASRQKLDPALEDQFQSGRLLACIASRPGQSGRADGYILEGEELAFYKRKLQKTKKAKSACNEAASFAFVVLFVEIGHSFNAQMK